LTGIFTLWSFFILSQDPTNSSTPLGGWLWAAALLTLLVTFLGAPPWPRGNGLLPGSNSDFFAKGIPHIPAPLEALLVGTVMLVGLLYRVVELEYMPGIFGDEGERGMDARAINEGRPANIFGFGWWGVPNLYFYLMAPFLRVFGDTMVGARMLSVISGLVAVWFVYKTARLLWGQRAGLIAGALMAVSPVALQFSRLAGESTPMAALWAVGFYFLFMALRYRRWSDWVLSGMAWGFSLYFYAAGKLIIPLAAAVALYCLVRWHVNFFKRYALGWALLLFAGTLVFMPYGLRSAKDQWVDFTGRANETSIFSPALQAGAFARYGIVHKAYLADQSLVSQVLSDPGAWSRLIFEQTRVSTEVLYRSPDPTAFLQLRENNGALLNPLWAVLAIMGLAYGAWKFWDGRFGIASLWFWGGLMGAALTMDTPSVQRLAGAWPALMLFPAALLDRVFAAGWPLSRNLARVWTSLALVAIIAYFAIDSHRVYFEHYKSTCPYCDATTQARYAQALGNDYKAYQLGVGASDTFFSYGSTRFVAKGIEGADLAVPNDYLPITDEGKGAAFIVLSNNAHYLPIIRAFYPMGTEESIKSADGIERFKSYKVTRQQIADTRTVKGSFTLPDGTLLLRDLPAFGRVDETSARWARGHGAVFPSQMTWSAGLVAPSYGMYTFEVKGGADARLEIDGRPVIQGAGTADMVLAEGLHDIHLSGTVAEGGKIDLLWAGSGAPPAPIPSRFVYNGSTGGLSGEFAPLSTYEAMRAPDPFGTTPRFLRRSDPFFGYRAATDSIGQAPFMARWQGWLIVPTDGTYTISTVSNGPSSFYLDGELLIDNFGNPNPPGSMAQVALTKGRHAIDIRFGWMNGRATFELFWTPPGSDTASIIPPSALAPLARSWPRSEVPDAPPAQMPQMQGPAIEAGKASTQVIGGLSNPHGIAVDGDGNIYVGDRGNGRVVVFGRDGNEIRSWGKKAPQGSTKPAPGEFVNISDLAVGPDGTVYVVDYDANRLSVFTREGQIKFTLDGDLIGVAPSNGADAAPNGEVYLASTSQSRVVVFPGLASYTEETKGNIATSARSITGGDGANKIEQPLDAAYDPVDPSRVYVADVRDRIARISSGGTIEREWLLPTGREDGGGRLAVSPDGTTLYLSDPDRHRVTVVNTTDDTVTYFGGPGTDPGQFRSPSGIAVGEDGRIYVVDRDNNRVQVFDP
jgi:DNA-binding beta-propeller fold protein YncE/4-amino-4-deoxy-L-arabinose transferase-like glycosyltransferase